MQTSPAESFQNVSFSITFMRMPCVIQHVQNLLEHHLLVRAT